MTTTAGRAFRESVPGPSPTTNTSLPTGDTAMLDAAVLVRPTAGPSCWLPEDRTRMSKLKIVPRSVDWYPFVCSGSISGGRPPSTKWGAGANRELKFVSQMAEASRFLPRCREPAGV